MSAVAFLSDFSVQQQESTWADLLKQVKDTELLLFFALSRLSAAEKNLSTATKMMEMC